ncbi:hypothetical protein ECG_01160 [Echinococcus granulosus]|uniref:Expressed conserved protein n=1 Tax=Echinococcus granulosus TaxID=6210 RepID=A0A068WE69_ECHGR|nr:hypothetical protein ECG_01160 [Echinococcus granulosus]CDS15946.1 expressed conserved protein [Echinococcus granulosus]
MCPLLQRNFYAIALVTVFLVCFTTAALKPSQIESKLIKMEKLRDLLDLMEEEEISDAFSAHPSYSKRWFPVKQYRGGLVAV